MVTNIVIGGAIFGYAGWALIRFISRSKKGKCAACSIQDSCAGGCAPSKK
ncbi:FeoB-associated Cys-rich membrane protein [Neobacillus piezotolerans]|uniref:FeoB-associated Cys-rich membrane protein n=1 Tax=Neobacillus piezotolerans TaxID=2259171 RepID=A0A3D8GLV3_9BACI|nr:FeoB-associated Cys-rich membrane protein [Neobacillus piezotolerans]RDU35341.1 FeoB-associated Cys-rich membrane protein [Neobacillus piezotolerans]